MHLDLTLDQLGAFRPLPELASHRGPIDGLYMTGAGTYPTGGVSAVPGRAAARVVLKDFGRHRKE
jgi:beta-carotene ketolase (CrtO type)